MRLMIKVRRLGYITTNAIIMICGSACASKDNLINIKDNLYILPALHDDSNESGLESLVIGKKKGKPLIIVLPGSGYYPIAYHAPDSNHYYTFHPDIISNTTKYNFLIVSKPHIPALAEWDEINPDTKTYMFNNDGELFGQYSNKNTIEHYVENLPKII